MGTMESHAEKKCSDLGSSGETSARRSQESYLALPSLFLSLCSLSLSHSNAISHARCPCLPPFSLSLSFSRFKGLSLLSLTRSSPHPLCLSWSPSHCCLSASFSPCISLALNPFLCLSLSRSLSLSVSLSHLLFKISILHLYRTVKWYNSVHQSSLLWMQKCTA